MVESRIRLNSREFKQQGRAELPVTDFGSFAYYGDRVWEELKIRLLFVRNPSQPFCATANPDPTLSRVPISPTTGYGQP